MQALKGLVVGLGLLIVVGVVLLGYGFYVQYQKKDVALFNDAADSPVVASPPVAGGPAAAVGTTKAEAPPNTGFGETRLDLPEGCTVTEMHPSGQRLYLRTGPAGLCERIVIIDTATGGLLGTIVVKP